MTVATLRAWPQVEIDGTPLSAELKRVLEQVVVDNHLHQPDMFMLRFRDLDRQLFSQAGLEVGKVVKISGTVPDGQTPTALIEGEVTALEAEYDASGAHAIARGYDASHRLHRGRTTQTYQNVKDSDVARTVAQRAGLQVGTIEDSGGTHEHLSQANMTDWEFLQSRAKEIKFEIGVEDGKFNFRRPVASSGAPGQGDYNSTNALQLVFGQDLLEFRPRVTSAHQVNDVKVRGWDVANKQALVGSAQAAASSASLQDTPASLANAFGSATHSLVDRPFGSQAEVDAAAEARNEHISSTFAEADGVARGIPTMKAGTAISVSQVADDFAGNYTLSRTRHVFDQEGYRTHFTVSGRHDRSLLGLISGASPNGNAAAGGPRIDGVVIAQVTDNADPDQLGRVKLKFPWLSDDYESHWARIVQLGAGPDSGGIFIPEVNDEVLVSFEFGDIRRPYVVGSLWNGQDKPNLGSGLFDNGKVKRRGFVSRKGHKFILFDDDNKSGIAFVTSDGNLKISLNETNSEIHISSQGKIHVECQQDLTLESQANLKLTAQQGITVEAQSNLDLKGMSTTLKSTSPSIQIDNGGGGKIELSGPQVNINSGALQVI